MLILDDYIDTWNYTFIVVALISLCVGSFLAIRNIKKQDLKSRREKRSSQESSEEAQKN